MAERLCGLSAVPCLQLGQPENSACERRNVIGSGPTDELRGAL